MNVSASEIIEVASSNLIEGGGIKYIVLDCRPRAEFDAGHLPCSAHLDPELLLEKNKSALDARVRDLAALRGCHICVSAHSGPRALVSESAVTVATSENPGSTVAEKDAEKDVTHDRAAERFILHLLAAGLSRLSYCPGGFLACHAEILNSSRLELVDHNPALCRACNPKSTLNPSNLNPGILGQKTGIQLERAKRWLQDVGTQIKSRITAARHPSSTHVGGPTTRAPTAPSAARPSAAQLESTDSTKDKIKENLTKFADKLTNLFTKPKPGAAQSAESDEKRGGGSKTADGDRKTAGRKRQKTADTSQKWRRDAQESLRSAAAWFGGLVTSASSQKTAQSGKKPPRLQKRATPTKKRSGKSPGGNTVNPGDPRPQPRGPASAFAIGEGSDSEVNANA